MKKLFIAAVVILLLSVGYFLITQRSSKLSPQTSVEKGAPAEQSATPPSQKTPFNTDDNLDQALQDLDQLDQL